MKKCLGLVLLVVATLVTTIACGNDTRVLKDRISELEEQLLDEQNKTALALEVLSEATQEADLALTAEREARLKAERDAKLAEDLSIAFAPESAKARYECNMKIASIYRITKDLIDEGISLWYEDDMTDEELDNILRKVLSNYPPDAVEMFTLWGIDALMSPEPSDGLQLLINDIESGEC